MNAPAKSDGNLTVLPPEVERKLRAMTRRVNSIIWLRGILATLAVALLATLLVMAADAAILIVDSRIRWFLTGLAAAATLAAAWHALVVPLRKSRVTPQRMARILETRHPEMQERISSALELLGQGGDAASQGSAQLIDLLAKGALSDVRGVKAKSEFAGRTMRPALSAVAVSAVVLGAIFAIWPRQGKLLFTRAIAPNISLPNLHAIGLSVEPGNAKCLRGAPLSLRLRARSGTDEPAEILISRGASAETNERMQKISDGVDGAVYEILIPSVDAPFDYRMVCGNGVTRMYSVSVVDPPSISSCVVIVEPPAYTRKASYSNETGVVDIDDIAGSRVSVSANFSTPCDALLMLGDIPLPPLSSADDGASARWSFTLSESSRGEWGIALRNRAGHTNRADRAAIRVRADAAPAITLSSPAEAELRLPPHGRLSLAYSLVEDMGLVATNLNIRREPSGAIARRSIPLLPTAPGRWYGTMELDLSEMDLSGVGNLRVWLTAMDNLPRELKGPQSATSREVLIHIDQHAQRHEVQKRKQAQEVARASFADAAARLDAAAAKTEALVARLGDPASTDSAIEELRAGPLHEAVKAERELRRIANSVGDLGLPPAAEEALREAIAEAVHPARQALEAVLLAPDEQRDELAESAAEALRSAAEVARNFMDRIETFDKARSKADAIEDLAARQRKAAADLERNPHDQAALQAYAQAQQELAQQLPKLVDASQEARKEELGAIADELRAKASELREQAADQRKQMEIAKRLADGAQRETAVEELKEHADALHAVDAEKAKNAAGELGVPTEQIADAAKKAQEAAELAAKAAELQQQGATRKAREDFAKAMQMANAATEAARNAVADAHAAAERARRDGVPHAEDVAERVEEASAQVEEAARLAQEASELASKAMKKPEADRTPFLEAAAERAQRAAQVARLAAENALLAEKELDGVGDTYELLYAEMGSEALEVARAAAQAAAMARQAAEMASEIAAIPPAEDPSRIQEQAAALREQAAQAAEGAREAAQAVEEFEQRADDMHAPEVAAQTAQAKESIQSALAAADQSRAVANMVDQPVQDYSNLAQEELTRRLDEAAQSARAQADNAVAQADAAQAAAVADNQGEQNPGQQNDAGETVAETQRQSQGDAAQETAEQPESGAEGPTPEQIMKGLEDRFEDYAEQARREVAEAEHAAQALDNGQSYMTTAQDMLWHSMQDARMAMEKLDEANPSEASFRQQMAAEHLEMAAAQMEQMADRMDAANPVPQNQPQTAENGDAPSDETPNISAEDVREIASNMAEAEDAMRDIRENFDALSPQERAVAESAVTAEDAAEQASDAAETVVEAAENVSEMFDKLEEAQRVEEATARAVEAAQKAEEAAKAVEAAAQARETARNAEDAKATHDAAIDNAAAAQAIEQSAAQLGELARQIGEHVEQALLAQPDAIEAAAKQAAELQGAADDAIKAVTDSAEAVRNAEQAVEAVGDNSLAKAAEQTSEAADAALAVAEKTAEAMDFAAKAAAAETPAERIELLQDAAESAAEARELAQSAAAEAQQAKEEAARQEQAAQQAEAQAEQQIVPEEQAQALAETAQNAVNAANEAIQNAAAPAAENADPATMDVDAGPAPESAQADIALPQSAVDAIEMARQAGEFAAKALEQLNETKNGASDDDAGMRLDQALEKSKMAENLAREAGTMASQASENAWQETLDLATAAAQNAAEAQEVAKQSEAAADKAAQQARQGGAQPTEEQREMLAVAKGAAQMAKQAAEQVSKALPQADEEMKKLNEAEKTARRDSATAAAESAKKAAQLAEAAAKTARALQPEDESAEEKAARRAAEAARENAEKLSKAAGNAARQAWNELADDAEDATDSADSDSLDDDSESSDADANGEKSSKAGKNSKNKHVEVEEIELELETFIKGFPASEWARIKGMRGSASLEEVLARVPADYRELVRRYFLALAEEAAKEEAEQELSK